MQNPLPFALRVAAGLVATGIERAKTLPEEIPVWSVTIAGQAAKLSLRVQQELAELASVGDEVLATFTRRDEEQPAWAHFDEDDEVGGVAEGESTAAGSADAGRPVALPDYDDLRISELRAQLGGLSADRLRELLEYEQAGRGRPAFLTLLQNRLTAASGDAAR